MQKLCFQTFGELLGHCPKQQCHFTFPPVVQEVQFLCILTNSCYCSPPPRHLHHPVECDMVSDYGFSLPLSVTNNSKHIFVFFMATCSFSLERYLKLFAHFQSGLFIFLLLQEFFLCLRYVSCQTCGLQMFVSNSMGSPFTSPTLFLEAQRLFCFSSPIYPKPGSTL